MKAGRQRHRISRNGLLLVLFAAGGHLTAEVAAPEVAEIAPEGVATIEGALDFWLGDWTVAWTDAEGKRHEGTNRIRRTLDGPVVHEQFAAPSMDFRGESFSVFDRPSGQWKQTWVDNSGNYMDFVGGPDGERFIFARTWTRANGERRENRMVFHSIAADSLIWDWEGRAVGEADWKRLWRLEYTRRPD